MITLTTITPYRGRPTALKRLLKFFENALRSSDVKLRHCIVFFSEPTATDEKILRSVCLDCIEVLEMQRPREDVFCIKDAHDFAAHRLQGNNDWIMKWDVDCISHPYIFDEIIELLNCNKAARFLSHYFFNIGMFYLRKATSLRFEDGLVSLPEYTDIVENIERHSATKYTLPAGTNWIVTPSLYMKCTARLAGFKGYGWEDYAQLYAFTAIGMGMDLLFEQNVTEQNVAQLCRDSISRPFAVNAFEQSKRLALLHCHHAERNDPAYKSYIEQNRKALYQTVTKLRNELF